MSITVLALPTTGVNVAAAAQGATATASSSYSSGYAASAVINGDRRGINYGGGGVWHDATGSSYPDWVEIAFAGSRSIDQVAVFTVQNAWSAPSEPTPCDDVVAVGPERLHRPVLDRHGMADGAQRRRDQQQPGVADDHVRDLTTTHIRVLAERAADGWSRLTEVEAYQSAAAAQHAALASASRARPGRHCGGAGQLHRVRQRHRHRGPGGSVAFYANGSLIAQDTTSPFSVPGTTWPPAPTR